MPIYPGRREGTWRVIVSVRNKPAEEIIEGSKTDARQHEARMLIELGARSKTSQRTAPAFSVLCAEEYAPHAQLRVAASTWRTRLFILASLVDHFGALPLSEFSTERIDGFVQARRAAGLRPSYINTDLAVLGAILRWARDDRKYPVGEFRIRPLRTDRRRVVCWSTEQVEALLDRTRRDDPWLEPVILFLLNTGCRKGESVAALWTWVDARARLLRIPVTDEWAPKSRKPREVPLSDALWSVLRTRPRSSSWIFPQPSGAPYKGFCDLRFRELRKAAGLPGSVHCTRHTFASHFLQAKPDLGLLARILGHSHTRTTELYAHLLPGHLESARNAVNLGGRMAKRRAG